MLFAPASQYLCIGFLFSYCKDTQKPIKNKINCIFSPKNLEVSKKVHIFAALKLKRVLEERDLIDYILEQDIRAIIGALHYQRLTWLRGSYPRALCGGSILKEYMCFS